MRAQDATRTPHGPPPAAVARAGAVACALAAAGCATDRWIVSWDLDDERAIGFFDCTDPAAFAVRDGCLAILGDADHRPPHRSPRALAILRDVEFGDFDWTLEAQQTGPEYPHRDLVLVFGYRDPEHFCYAHLANRGDEHAHHVMLVDGADRRPVTTWRTAGVDWGEGWHRLRLSRSGEAVAVSFDGEVVLRAVAPRWRGRIGVGSFDDTGRFRRLCVSGQGAR